MDTIRREWPILLGAIAITVLYLYFQSDIHPIDSINALVLSIFWLVVIAFGARALYLPVQYVRHQLAVRQFLASEADLHKRASAGDAVAKVRLSLAVEDPRDTPWWRW